MKAPVRTAGHWAWQKFGSEWCLVAQDGMRSIVLSTLQPTNNRAELEARQLCNIHLGHADDDTVELVASLLRRSGTPYLTSLVGGLLRPLDPTHPDARLIAAAPELLEVLHHLVNSLARVAAAQEPATAADADILVEPIRNNLLRAAALIDRVDAPPKEN